MIDWKIKEDASVADASAGGEYGAAAAGGAPAAAVASVALVGMSGRSNMDCAALIPADAHLSLPSPSVGSG